MNKQTFLSNLKDLESRFEQCDPELVLTVRDPELDLEGYLVCWNTKIALGGPLEFTPGVGCAKGGTRITPEVELDEIKMLARSAALKNAAAGLAMGGAKSGLKADPDAPDFEKKYRRFVSLLKPVLRENGGVFGGFGFDIGARPQHPIWACDELGTLNSFTGKPVDMGGTDYDKEGIAGLGVALAAKRLIELNAEKIEEVTFAVQGLGAMGSAVIRYFSEEGGQLRVISDPRIDGTWALSDGPSAALLEALSTMDFEKIESLVKKEGTKSDLNDVLVSEVDVLFPCAVQYVITDQNAPLIKARYISEGANNPTTAEAYTLLFERGVQVVPDFIANPGGVIAAFIELTSNVTPEENVETRAKVEEAKSYTRDKIAENVTELHEMVKSLGVQPTQVGRYLSLSRMFAS